MIPAASWLSCHETRPVQEPGEDQPQDRAGPYVGPMVETAMHPHPGSACRPYYGQDTQRQRLCEEDGSRQGMASHGMAGGEGIGVVAAIPPSIVACRTGFPDHLLQQPSHCACERHREQREPRRGLPAGRSRKCQQGCSGEEHHGVPRMDQDAQWQRWIFAFPPGPSIPALAPIVLRIRHVVAVFP